eukprot:TRINITY_DN4293_c1_g3_i2.p1 TRINITY_DN4293_c1_g3~~TRINITY_DN4293_c1_g3_i2.p1  ORF type:complete len:737 (-),score=132.91 TRINITY_DN4293_c1_g3_i2:2114-4183(-)
MKSVRRILDTTRHPKYAADVDHHYDDKYALVEFLTNITLAANFNCFTFLGVHDLTPLKDWAEKRSVSLRFVSEERCQFIKKTKRKAEEPVQTSKTFFGTKRVFEVIEEYWYQYEFDYEIFAFQGNDPENKIIITKHSCTCEILVEDDDKPPRPELSVPTPIDLDITWALSQLKSKDFTTNFSINRVDPKCHTPRRNTEVIQSLEYLSRLFTWAHQIFQYIYSQFLLPAKHGLDISKIHSNQVFVPSVPLFERKKREEGKRRDPSVALDANDFNVFLQEQVRSLQATFTEMETLFPSAIIEAERSVTVTESSELESDSDLVKTPSGPENLRSPRKAPARPKKPAPKPIQDFLISAIPAKLMVLLLHIKELCQQWLSSVDYVEEMIRKQLIAAIGKELTPKDFGDYMVFHNRKLFGEKYMPRFFSHAIRVPGRHPEGVIEINSVGDDGRSEPIQTIMRKTIAASPMSFSLTASTKVQFYGERYVHAYVAHQFSEAPPTRLNLVARARQLSSFIILVGRIPAPHVFDPTCAVIVKNKDLLTIPLIMNAIPTPKAFKAAVESMSPEMIRFAKAIRSMQLSDTLFGICVIQIRPQLEKLLKLPPDSLTQELKLNQDLLDLFLEYQIPSDLLTFDGYDDAPPFEKINRVKQYTAKMSDVIREANGGISESAQSARNSRTRKRSILRSATFRKVRN